jgi:hypothetical protein
MKDVTSRRWIGLVFISLAVALIIVDSTIVNVDSGDRGRPGHHLHPGAVGAGGIHPRLRLAAAAGRWLPTASDGDGCC